MVDGGAGVDIDGLVKFDGLEFHQCAWLSPTWLVQFNAASS